MVTESRIGDFIGSNRAVVMAEDAPKEADPPLEEDVMRLARFGEIGQIQKLFDTGKATASYKDASGLTPLHVCLEALSALA